jgi:hypothetical protein
LKTRRRCRYRNGRKDIAEIDVAKLPMEVEIIDLRTPIDRTSYELQNEMESARSTKNKKIIMYTCHLKTLFTLSDIQQSIAIGINLATK